MTSTYRASSRTDPDRERELAAGLERARGQIAEACAAAGRSPADVRLIAVGKTFPAADAASVVRAGQTDLGENKAQELAPKAEALREQGLEPTWHFIGQLQRNKVRQVLASASWIHSVDRTSLVDAIARAAERPVNVCLQVDLGADPGRGGVSPDDLLPLAEHAAAQENLRVRGVMTVAPLDWDADRAFTLLAELSGKLRSVVPGATEISAGMSQDLSSAVAHGATMVRLGRTVFGAR
ncbi:YggS family pyridoxal phosphate-dependent enzyme [Salininema proteolyticum]|uniref:Pyridoxal phosphate homeostasis protein n=1 Tax=Salininema proteolyticum TaxID=1607685 RepID=A0ABV8TYS7_9ACTN